MTALVVLSGGLGDWHEPSGQSSHVPLWKSAEEKRLDSRRRVTDNAPPLLFRMTYKAR